MDRDRPVSDGPGNEPGPAPAAEPVTVPVHDPAEPGGPAARDRDAPERDTEGDAEGGTTGGGSGAENGTADGGGAFHAEVRDALAGLSARLDREHERAAHREAVIDRLHEENQRLRRGELHTVLEPVRAALFRLHDQARRESDRLTGADGGDPPGPRQTALLLEAVADDVADALARLGVERFTAEPGDPYDPSRHRPVAVTAVSEPARDGTVVTVQSDGFEQGGRILRKAAVSVGRHGGATGGKDRDTTGGKDRGTTAGTTDGTGGDTAGDSAAAVRTGSSRHRAAGRGETMNTALGTDR
ncbi:nucleotide exchange factor GrpE [Actinomadura roseirufa]|uniref:nucleotide exchange factor GrpE n=1 Tax=Actinomadura roseirufa TaxID=2094049 RepID=UPI0010419C82|nr:nucleotide exchange factor GrpE [Actinomadura roseirufa]